MKQSDVRDDRKERWTFVHTYVKSMIYNLISTIAYSSKMFKTVIERKEDINSSGLREVYRCFNRAYDSWLERRDARYRHDIKDSIKRIMNIFFTVANDDWVYEDLARELYNEIGKSYINTLDYKQAQSLFEELARKFQHGSQTLKW